MRGEPILQYTLDPTSYSSPCKKNISILIHFFLCRWWRDVSGSRADQKWNKTIQSRTKKEDYPGSRTTPTWPNNHWITRSPNSFAFSAACELVCLRLLNHSVFASFRFVALLLSKHGDSIFPPFVPSLLSNCCYLAIAVLSLILDFLSLSRIYLQFYLCFRYIPYCLFIFYLYFIFHC